MNFNNCQPEVASDVIFGDSMLKPLGVSFLAGFSNVNVIDNRASDAISGVVVDPTGMGFCVKFGNSRSNHSRDI